MFSKEHAARPFHEATGRAPALCLHMPLDLSTLPKDEATCKLPHPLRVQRCLQEDLAMWEHAVGTREWRALVAAFQDPAFMLSNMAQLLQEQKLYRLQELFGAAAHSVGSNELGGAMATFVGLRHLLSPNRLFRLDDDLVELLGHTDLDADIPVSFLKLPYPRCYVELGHTRVLDAFVYNGVTGDHVLEGAYFEQGQHGSEGEGLYVMMTGSPLGKQDAMDDATHAVFIRLDNPELSLSQAIDQAYARSRVQSAQVGLSPPDDQGYARANHNLALLAKALLYISLPEARKTVALERSELQAQAQRLSSASKRAKLLRRIQRSCDVVTVHAPAVTSEQEGAATAGDSAANSARASYWRRGHYRRQPHGPQNSLRKLIFIAPVRVMGLGNVAEPAANKNYRVQL